MISLYELFLDVNEKHFGNSLPAIDLHWNSRLRSAAGRFFPGSRRIFLWGGVPLQPRIEIASYLLELEDAQKLIEDTLGHEMVHFWLWVRKKPYGHTAEFKAKLKAIGYSRYNPVPQLRPPKYIYGCPHCGKEFFPKRRLKGLACLACCKVHSQGKFDARFRLVFKSELKVEKKKKKPRKVDLHLDHDVMPTQFKLKLP